MMLLIMNVEYSYEQLIDVVVMDLKLVMNSVE